MRACIAITMLLSLCVPGCGGPQSPAPEAPAKAPPKATAQAISPAEIKQVKVLVAEGGIQVAVVELAGD